MFAKVFLEQNPSATLVILDSAQSIGGVWATERLYPGLKTNNMLGTYEYPDFPMDEKTFGVKPGEFIPGPVVHRYLDAFAERFNLKHRIQFGTKVVSAIKGVDGWELCLSAEGLESPRLTAQKLVLATGNTSEPQLPAFPGAETFTAPMFHVKDLAARIDTIPSPREIVVIGGTKSAWDAAHAFAHVDGNQTVHMVIRQSGHGPIWMAPPRVTPFNLWLEKLVHTRLLTLFSPCIWGLHDGFVKSRNFLHGTAFGRWIVNAFWHVLADDVRKLNGYDQHHETSQLQPWSNPMFLGSGLSILNYPKDRDFFSLVRNKKIQVHIADVVSMNGDTIHLSNGEKLVSDAVVCSTGWKHRPPLKLSPGSDAYYGLPHATTSSAPDELLQTVDKEILTTFPRLRDQPVQNPRMTPMPVEEHDSSAPSNLNAPYKLYKFMVPPSTIGDRSLGFVGVPSTISTSIIASIQALWLTAYFSGELAMPVDKHAVEYEATLHSRFGYWRYPAGHGAQYPDFVFDALPYCDMLLQQLGLESHRKGNVLKELFYPYGPEDYRNLVDEWRGRSGKEKTA